MARGFAAAGAHVVIASRKVEPCEAVATAIRNHGGSAIGVATHVGDPDALDALVAATVDRFGGVDILVNNAANPLGGMLADVTELAFQKSYEVNVRAPLFLAQRALPHLQASSHASIINVITAGAFQPGPGLGLYCSGKGALWSLTRVMAKEWAPLGVRVNALAPGPFDTEMMAATLAVPEFHRSVVEATVLRRVAKPDELIGAALFLASDASSYVTGSVIPVDGGILA